MDAEETICRAIANRHYLQFRCDGAACIAEPHQLGRDRDGHLVLRAFLIAGHAEDEGPGWRAYRIEDFNWALESTEQFVEPRPGYQKAPNDVIVSAVCEL